MRLEQQLGWVPQNKCRIQCSCTTCDIAVTCQHNQRDSSLHGAGSKSLHGAVSNCTRACTVQQANATFL
eukprot:scaffold293559_cov24-Tisochrysis_lutea.AAC.1